MKSNKSNENHLKINDKYNNLKKKGLKLCQKNTFQRNWK